MIVTANLLIGEKTPQTKQNYNEQQQKT